MRRLSDVLWSKGADIVVVACNTATSMAIETLRKTFSVPIIGMEPAVKPASVKHHGEKILVCCYTTHYSRREAAPPH